MRVGGEESNETTVAVVCGCYNLSLGSEDDDRRKWSSGEKPQSYGGGSPCFVVSFGSI